MPRRSSVNYLPYVLGGIFLLVIIFFIFKNRPINESAETGGDHPIYLEIGDTMVNVEVASTPQTRSKGLAGREELAQGWGMLFVFEEAERHPFWMKDVKFSLDIIWIGENWQIVGFEENVPPYSYPQTYRSPKPVLYVLEVNRGFVAHYQIKAGQTVKLIEEGR